MEEMSLISKVIAMVTPENLGKCLDTFSKGVGEFGNAMSAMTNELSSDMAKSDRRARKQGTKYVILPLNVIHF